MAETKSKGKGGKKLGPFPLWVWGLILVGGAAAFYLYQKKKQAKATPTAQPTAQPSAYAGSPAVGTLASQVPQFVNQTYTNPTPQSITQTVTQTQKPPPVPPPPHKGGDEDHGKHQPGGTGRTGGWKGQHNNGQGSHPGRNPGGARQPAAPPPPQRPPHMNPGGPIIRPGGPKAGPPTRSPGRVPTGG